MNNVSRCLHLVTGNQFSWNNPFLEQLTILKFNFKISETSYDIQDGDTHLNRYRSDITVLILFWCSCNLYQNQFTLKCLNASPDVTTPQNPTGNPYG